MQFIVGKMSIIDRRRIVGVISGVLGLIAIVTPFYMHWLSPLFAIIFALRGSEGEESIFIFSIAAPFLLAIPITVWQVRRVFVPSPTKVETVLAYILSTTAMLPVFILSVITFLGHSEYWQEITLSITALLVYWFGAIGNLVLLFKNRVSGRAPGVIAEVFLLLGYLPNALYALIGFSYGSIFWSDPMWLWGIGAYVVLTTCVLYAAQVVLLLRDGKAPSPPLDVTGEAPHTERP